MPRTKRKWISGQAGSLHIISRSARNDVMFNEEEKEYLMELIERFGSGFYVDIHAFCVMGTHFHILASSRELEAKKAGNEELYQRYRAIYGKNAEPPAGSYETDGGIIPDEDGGVERLRQRLGSISRFVQELKQTFTKWYNNKHGRKGYLWNDRFKGVIVGKGEAQLACSAYIDLNPVRADMVEQPEDYRWCGLGLRVRNPGRSRKLLGQFLESIIGNSDNIENGEVNPLSWYREFVYLSGGIEKEGKEKISGELVNEVKSCHGKLGIGDSFRYRIKNISEGIAIGSFSFISLIQERYKRKFISPRSFLAGNRLFATRVLRL